MDRTYTWFLEPLDKDTNEVIARELANLANVSDVDHEMLTQVLCADKKRHNLWRCPFDFVSKIMRSAGQMNLRFKIFNREGKGEIRECAIMRKKKRGKPQLPTPRPA